MRDTFRRWLVRLRLREGQGLVEYCLILALVAVIVMVALAKISDPTGHPVTELTQTFAQT